MLENDITELQNEEQNLSIKVTQLESNDTTLNNKVVSLQNADVSLNERVSALENGGSGGDSSSQGYDEIQQNLVNITATGATINKSGYNYHILQSNDECLITFTFNPTNAGGFVRFDITHGLNKNFIADFSEPIIAYKAANKPYYVGLLNTDAVGGSAFVALSISSDGEKGEYFISIHIPYKAS